MKQSAQNWVGLATTHLFGVALFFLANLVVNATSSPGSVVSLALIAAACLVGGIIGLVGVSIMEKMLHPKALFAAILRWLGLFLAITYLPQMIAAINSRATGSQALFGALVYLIFGSIGLILFVFTGVSLNSVSTKVKLTLKTTKQRFCPFLLLA